MKNEQALKIITDMQKWRRGQPPYDGIGRPPKYSPEQYGEALDAAIRQLQYETGKKE